MKRIRIIVLFLLSLALLTGPICSRSSSSSKTQKNYEDYKGISDADVTSYLHKIAHDVAYTETDEETIEKMKNYFIYENGQEDNSLYSRSFNTDSGSYLTNGLNLLSRLAINTVSIIAGGETSGNKDNKYIMGIHKKRDNPHKTLVVAFRGTVVSYLKNLYNDSHPSFTDISHLKSCQNYENSECLVNQGFNTHWLKIQEHVLEDIKQMIEVYKPDDIIFTGHSLGGATATVAAFYYSSTLSNYNGRKVSLVTFGSPRVGNVAFAINLNYFLYLKYNARVTYVDDSVTSFYDSGTFKGKSVQYIHVGVEVKFNDDEDYILIVEDTNSRRNSYEKGLVYNA